MKKQITEIKEQIQSLMLQIGNLRPEEIKISMFLNMISELSNIMRQLDLLQTEIQQAEFEKEQKAKTEAMMKEAKKVEEKVKKDDKKFNEN